jgi:hypothetical protein
MRAWMLSLSLLLAGGAAQAQRLNQIKVGDLPGTDGRWQYGEVTVAAPAEVVQRWFAEPAEWQRRFPDNQWAHDLGRTPDGKQIAEFRSKVLDRTLRVEMTEQPGLITYKGAGKGIKTQGKIFIQQVGPMRTKVTMQSTGELHGLTGLVAPESVKRDRAIKKLTADLMATARLANEYAATTRHGG